MKPNFALTLSFEEIGLLHRTQAGWHLVGEVGLGAADLTADLAALAAKARTLDPTGLRSKIVLPDEQIKYLSFDTAEQDAGLIGAQVREALDGATPYALNELTYDWSVRHGVVHVAAVARETLAEAEEFAIEHAFNPLCFVAMPDESAFAGEPFFGETAHAAKVLGPDDTVERENAVIRIIGAAHLPAPEPAEAGRRQPQNPEQAKARIEAAEPKAAPVAFSSTRGAAKLGGQTRAPELPKARLSPPPPDALAPIPKAPPEPDIGPAAASPALQPAKQKDLNEAQRMTVFGARQTGSAQPDRPRYLALILTAILLLVLVAIAAWAALFLDSGVAGLFRSDEPRIAATPPTAPKEEAGETAGKEEEPADLAAARLPEDAANPAGQIAETPPTPRPAAVPEELPPDEARARYAATGIWQMAPEPPGAPGITTLEEVYQTNLDAEVNFGDAVALPGAGALRPAPRPPTPANPPPPGVRFQLDDRGFIAATPEGTETPEGVTVFSGPPPVEPSAIPPRAAPQALDEPAAAAPAGPARRPRLRPQSAQQIAEEAHAAEAGIDPDAENDDPLAGATAQAVAASLKPRTRPDGFAAIVERSRQAAAAEPVSQDQKVTVSIPTAASVARAATGKDQVSLRKINLIGVYGAPDSRRALVRLANGQYRKVQVGDRLDGGQVAAIGEDELRYIKRGRSVVLKMPNG